MSVSRDAVPLITWVLAGGSVVVLTFAAALILSASHNSTQTSAADEPAALDAPPPGPEATEPPSRVLDISEQQLDARRRAQEWSPHFRLAEMRARVAPGQLVESLEIVYGHTNGPAKVGAPLTTDRLTLSYSNWSPGGTQPPEISPGRESRIAPSLPEPNCPLEAAVRAVTQAGGDAERRFGAVYMHSTKYDRAVWTITMPEGAPLHVDANNCALLKR